MFSRQTSGFVFCVLFSNRLIDKVVRKRNLHLFFKLSLLKCTMYIVQPYHRNTSNFMIRNIWIWKPLILRYRGDKNWLDIYFSLKRFLENVDLHVNQYFLYFVELNLKLCKYFYKRPKFSTKSIWSSTIRWLIFSFCLLAWL